MQDINEYCLRNQRAKTKQDDELKEKARQDEELRQIQIENEKQLGELVKGISSQINKDNKFIKSEDQNVSEPKSELVMDEGDPFLKKIYRNLNTVPSLLSPLNPLDVEVINYFNLNEDTTNSKSSEEDEFQLIEGDEATDMVVLRSNLNLFDNDLTALSSDCNILKRSNRTLTTNNLNIEHNDIECGNKRIKADEVEAHTISKHNSDMVIAVLANQLVETVIKNALEIHGKDETYIQPESKALANFNDSNDLSMSIEVEQLPSTLDDLKQQGYISNICKSRIDSSTIEEDECNDSDIEVLSVSSKFVKNLIDLVKINIEQENQINFTPNEQSTETESNMLAGSTNSMEEAVYTTFENSQNSTKSNKCEDLITINQFLSENNLIFSSSPLSHLTEQLMETKLFADKPIYTNNQLTNFLIDSANPCNLVVKDHDDTKNQLANALKTEENEELSQLLQIEPNENLKTLPFFKSKLTNSQLSEELSHEIGFSFN